MANPERIIGIPVDASDHSEKACDWYLKNMKQANDVVVIIHVSEMTHSGSIETIKKEDWEQHVKDHTEKVKEIEEKYNTKLTKAEVGFEVKLCGGKPGEAICSIIKERGIDLVIMGSRGMGAIRRTFVGSVSDYVLHHAHVPVIICPKH
ncbi:uncharacterized protein LOC113666530 [Pocillopora damicornis]|uniref:uncharacterized protein LOC113666530 n=1 Tax=Pocillopora damicornis TaxID=46731 RepID=UPI000F54FB6A|nr:uncharacterized protein LOC113666530 [Pocillopora damicornis]